MSGAGLHDANHGGAFDRDLREASPHSREPRTAEPSGHEPHLAGGESYAGYLAEIRHHRSDDRGRRGGTPAAHVDEQRWVLAEERSAGHGSDDAASSLLVRRNRVLETLPESEKRRLAPYFTDVDLRFGETLITAGQPICNLYFPHDAMTATVVYSASGTAIEVGIMGAEGVVGHTFITSGAATTNVVVQIPGRAARISAEDFDAHVRTPGSALFEQLLRYNAVFLGMVAQTAACNRLHSLEQRLCRWLLMVHDRVGRSELPLTHEYLAEMLGVRRAGVSTTAARLQELGAISYSRGVMSVRHRSTLLGCTCECYGLYIEQARAQNWPDAGAEDDDGETG